ncbi:MAG TPA: beta-galactosidase, partial [Puia sp.]|nr:beta-galactosidase [Puia sp.]
MSYGKFLLSVLATVSFLVPTPAQTRNAAQSGTQSGTPSPAQSSIPHLIPTGKSVQLRVDNKPFIVLGGELGNSSASDMHYMQPFWNKFISLHLNTILSPVYWELMEPSEGRFDFRLVDSMIHTARRYRLKVILLWFGSWKNSMSCYAPQWIKSDTLRFPRARNNSGKRMEILSAFSNNNLEADCHAFAALMKHLRGTDTDHTVIMVQVENEIGLLQAARERTAGADSAFDRPVPPELINYLTSKKDSLVPELSNHWGKTNFTTAGSWATVFGNSLTTDEIFQAWFYARYANRVADAGKKEYALPMYVNAALNHRNVLPGEYPSAGPLPQVMDIWQAAAPAIDFLSPDFYNPRFAEYGDLY